MPVEPPARLGAEPQVLDENGFDHAVDPASSQPVGATMHRLIITPDRVIDTTRRIGVAWRWLLAFEGRLEPSARWNLDLGCSPVVEVERGARIRIGLVPQLSHFGCRRDEFARVHTMTCFGDPEVRPSEIHMQRTGGRDGFQNEAGSTVQAVSFTTAGAQPRSPAGKVCGDGPVDILETDEHRRSVIRLWSTEPVHTQQAIRFSDTGFDREGHACAVDPCTAEPRTDPLRFGQNQPQGHYGRDFVDGHAAKTRWGAGRGCVVHDRHSPADRCGAQGRNSFRMPSGRFCFRRPHFAARPRGTRSPVGDRSARYHSRHVAEQCGTSRRCVSHSTSESESKSVPPLTWLPMKYPRRGGYRASVAPVDPDAGVELAKIETDELSLQYASWYLVNDTNPDELTIDARKYQAGDVSALGAAALYFLLNRFVSRDELRVVSIIDGWVARHGLVFAVEALLELSDMRFVSERVLVADLPEGAVISVVSYGHTAPDAVFEVPKYTTRERFAQVDGYDEQLTYSPREYMLERMRGLIAVASDEDYAAARSVASTLRGNTVRKLTATFIFPTELEWSEELIMVVRPQSYHWSTQLMVSANTPEQLHRSDDAYGHRRWLLDDAMTAAVVDGIGPPILPVLLDAFDTPNPYGNAHDESWLLRILHALSAIPTDDAFKALVRRGGMKNGQPIVLRAMQNYPRRAFRVLVEADSGLFDRHVRRDPDLAREIASTLPERAQRRIAELTTLLPMATDLPSILVSPPWSTRKKMPDATAITGLEVPDLHKMAWLPGELEAIKNRPGDYSYTTWDSYKQYIPDPSPTGAGGRYAWIIFLIAPDEIARPFLTDWEGTTLKDPLRVVARYELDALPLMLRFTRAHPGAAAPYLMPYVDLDVARVHATMFATRKNLRKPALAWLVRHAADAATLLIPDAVGKAGAQKDHAAAALRGLARATSRDTVLAGANRYGDDVSAAIATIVDLDPLEVLPKRIPKTPAWADAPSLPPILTADRSAALPDSATAHILTMCAVSTIDAPYAGLETVTSYCDRGLLADAAWELFQRWWGAGAPSKGNWVILALGWLGDDSTIGKLAPLIRRWPGENGTARAQLGLDALAAHGSTRALTELDHISRKMKFKSLKVGAQQRVAEVAESLGLDREQLADRIVPTLDLSSSGTMMFDYGERSFTVGFTEALVPYVLDENGKKTTSLPKPTTRDDAILAEEAKTRFAALKREAKAVATEQIKRLNRSMVIGRRWTADEFTQYVLGHPLLIHVARRLLWASFDDNNKPAVVFRVAEDSTLADVDDDALELPDGRIGLVHPAHIPDTVGTWSNIFADYEILQPFPQLGRSVHDPLPGDIDGSGLARFTGVTATPSQALRLTYRGWEPVWENPVSWGQGLLYQLSDDVSVLLGLEPGMGTGDPYNGYPDQKLVEVSLRGGTLNDVDRATVSELIADLDGFAS
ncbi:hypothetical protein CH252_28925 [Rhodococcus sp. 06-1477-1B]|nr:hypothetical protein CH252_28925 [Rhodococcus sp. 06-1477-1B]OZD50822.1 hypothetical protein CH266_14150 [Rhodococcus sp. 06-1474-1B]